MKKEKSRHRYAGGFTSGSLVSGADATGMAPLRASGRRALLLALADCGPADGGRPGAPGPTRATWERLQARGLLDPAHPLPSARPPAVTDAGLRALGLPDRVDSPEVALRAAVRCLLPWRRPAVRVRPRLPFVSIDHPDDPLGDPIVVSAHPEVIAAVSTDNERAWEHGDRCADTAWDAVCAWTARVGFPLDLSHRGAWRLVFHDHQPALMP